MRALRMRAIDSQNVHTPHSNHFVLRWHGDWDRSNSKNEWFPLKETWRGLPLLPMPESSRAQQWASRGRAHSGRPASREKVVAWNLGSGVSLNFDLLCHDQENSN